MSKTLLIIVSGPPASGKTTLGKIIAKEFRLAFLNKDSIKESLFDILGIKDREWSKKVGSASYSILYRFMETLLVANQSLVVDSNFRPEFDTKKFLDLKQKYTFITIQIMCKADGEILFERFKKRVESGERHPGHVDHNNYEEFKKGSLSQGEEESLVIGGKVFDVDTTDFESIDYDSIFSTIKSATNST